MEDEELDYNSIGMKNSAIDKLKGNTPTPIPLKPVGERQYGQSIVSSEIVDGRRKITTTTPWSQNLAGQGLTYKQAGVDPAAAKQYWQANPDKYKEYLKSKTGMQTGKDVSVRFEDIPTPAPTPTPSPPKTPPRRATSYKYRAGGMGSESVGGAKSLAGAKYAAQKFGNLNQTVIDKVYDEKAYGPNAMGRLIQSSEAMKANEIREGQKSNPNWKKDLMANKQMYSQMRKDVAAWRKAGSDPNKVPKSVQEFQKRIDNSYERVFDGGANTRSNSSAAAYKFQKFNN